METTFCELKNKEVINVIDGKRLGHIIDMVFEQNCGKILGLIVPGMQKSWNWFKPCDNIFIPFSNICKIGRDVILVELFLNKQNVGALNKNDPYTTTAQISETTIQSNKNYQQWYKTAKKHYLLFFIRFFSLNIIGKSHL